MSPVECQFGPFLVAIRGTAVTIVGVYGSDTHTSCPR